MGISQQKQCRGLGVLKELAEDEPKKPVLALPAP